MKFFRLLGFRLFLILSLVMLVGTTIVTLITTNWQSEQYLGAQIRSAFQTSDIIKRSTHYSMLLNRREDIYQIINTIGSESGIHGIRVYDKQGTARFSTNPQEVGTKVDMKAEACNACHTEGEPPTSPNPDALTRVFYSPRGYRVLGMITPIHNDSSCSTADCHAHPESQTVLGVLDVMLPLTEVDALLENSTRKHYQSSILYLVLVATVSGLFIWILVYTPIKGLMRGTEEITRGNLTHRIPVRSNDEIGVLAKSFNHMTDELQRAREEVLKWTHTLEERVASKSKELERAHNHFIHVEKMASLGKLAATVAHEINNPLEGILTYAKLLKKKVLDRSMGKEKMEEIQTELTLIADETARCGSIVKNLLLFAKKDLGEFRNADLRTIVERSLKLISHHLQMHNITHELQLGNYPIIVHCDPNQIEQALLALEINAIEAMTNGGKLDLILLHSESENTVRLQVRDNGIGIPKEDFERIFEPFYSTKEEGKGTGLGLAVVFGIIERHSGTIEVDAREGAGMIFTITLPLAAAYPTAQNNATKGTTHG